MSLREAAQQALEALETFQKISDFTPAQGVHAITALRTALAEPEQEPVAWMDACGNLFYSEEDAYKTGFQPIQTLMRFPKTTDARRYEPGSFKWNTPPDEPELLKALKRIVDEPNNTMSDGESTKRNHQDCQSSNRQSNGDAIMSDWTTLERMAFVFFVFGLGFIFGFAFCLSGLGSDK